MHGDRLWAVRDVERDVTATARRVPALLGATARYVDVVPADAGPGNAPEVAITFPDGTVLSSNDPGVHAKLSELVTAGRLRCAVTERVAFDELPKALQRLANREVIGKLVLDAP